jgi:hypothetical protein
MTVNPFGEVCCSCGLLNLLVEQTQSLYWAAAGGGDVLQRLAVHGTAPKERNFLRRAHSELLSMPRKVWSPVDVQQCLCYAELWE